MDYTQLEALPASAYLDPDRFRTSWPADARPEYCREQYEHGLSVSREAAASGGAVTIAENSVWGAHGGRRANGVAAYWLSSYEGIGFHAGTADLLRGFLDGPAPIHVYRRDTKPTIILNRQIVAK